MALVRAYSASSSSSASPSSSPPPLPPQKKGTVLDQESPPVLEMLLSLNTCAEANKWTRLSTWSRVGTRVGVGPMANAGQWTELEVAVKKTRDAPSQSAQSHNMDYRRT